MKTPHITRFARLLLGGQSGGAVHGCSQQVSKWTAQEKAMRNKTAQATSSENVAGMATNAMNALQSLPEHKDE